MNPQNVKWLFSLLKPYRGWVFLGAMLSGFTICANMGLLATSAVLLSKAALMPPLLWLMTLITGVRFFGIARALLRYIERLLNHSIAYRILGGLRVRVYKKLENLVPDRLIGYTEGMFYRRMLLDIEVLQYFYLRAVSLPLAFFMVLICGAIFLSFFAHKAIIILGVCMFLAGIVVPTVIRKSTRSARGESAQKRTQLSDTFLDYQHGLVDLLMHPKALKNWQEKMNKYHTGLVDVQFFVGKLSSLGDRTITFLSHLTMLGALAVAVPLVQTGRLEGVYLAMVGMVVWVAFEAAEAMPKAIIQVGDSLQAGEELRKIEEIETPVRQATEQKLSSREIILKDVSFQYHQKDEIFLSNINLTVSQGEHIAFVGQSGSGKSSLARLIAGLWQCDDGEISYGGNAYTDLGRAQLAREIAYLEQKSTIFHATMRENLLLANPKATIEQLEKVLKAVDLWDAVQLMPEKMETILAEDGSRLSGGQRQRLSIARLLLKNPSVVILDEPTQNLDQEYVTQMMSLLLNWSRDKTLILITHDLKFLQTLDSIYLLQHGKIIETGSHHTLINIPQGRYRKLYNIMKKQF
ncbi:ATP-binding cassette, subfamily C, CydC [Desulfonispora thiosulfatigenes DSM 11270]|uniref:ATP-binding cassette, subfamily C, CydC n=1 Tax=Desulfonispora thiosulfatigenes DSM 11270 TaxID=656914 RepID=A0A1W1UFV9_DESTI|nr:thiol reductant ABC exporter subunit CydC [Desulfonispora thiosulfatigenes]SMB79912.1 ATP-binding cassette, subfamily C, CydC [Desulfonispora thiosulfatigenes DSM 11270]